MTDRELMQQALEALESTTAEWKALADSGDAGFWKAEDQDDYKKCVAVIAALRERLAQPEQEDYTTPPRREWVGMTDEEIAVIASTPCAVVGSYVHTFARAIEAKLKEKNA